MKQTEWAGLNLLGTLLTDPVFLIGQLFCEHFQDQVSVASQALECCGEQFHSR